ncbi:MAG: magnesium transporter, partial [Pseudomonadota bacterium]
MVEEQSIESNEPEREDEDAYVLDNKAVARIMYSVDIDDQALLKEELEPLHAADIADLLEQINAFDRRRLILLLGEEFDGDILSELDEGLREEVLELLKPEVLADTLRALDSDDVVDLLEDLDDEQQEVILDALEDGDRLAAESALAYPEDSAGRMMQREVVMAPEHWNVGEAIDFLRDQDDLPEQFYHITLVDPRLRPVANVTLGKLMGSRREVLLQSITEDTFHVIPVTQDEADVAYAFNQYHLI